MPNARDYSDPLGRPRHAPTELAMPVLGRSRRDAPPAVPPQFRTGRADTPQPSAPFPEPQFQPVPQPVFQRQLAPRAASYAQPQQYQSQQYRQQPAPRPPAPRKTSLTAAEQFWYILMCIGLGAGYFAKIPAKKALHDFGLAEMTAAEKFWYVLMCLPLGAGYFAKIPVAKAITEMQYGR